MGLPVWRIFLPYGTRGRNERLGPSPCRATWLRTVVDIPPHLNMHAWLVSKRLLSRASAARSFASQPSAPGLQSLLEKRPNDVVITFAKRTAMGKAKKGQFKSTPVDEILSGLLKVCLLDIEFILSEQSLRMSCLSGND